MESELVFLFSRWREIRFANFPPATNYSVPPGAAITYSIGTGSSGGAGGDTWAIVNTTLLAKGGGKSSALAGAAGGALASGYGDVKYSGGTGGTAQNTAWSPRGRSKKIRMN